MTAIRFEACIERYGENGDKTGWWFVTLPQALAAVLHPEDRKAFRVKGRIGGVPVEQLAVQPKADGDYLIALNAPLRRKLRKTEGEKLKLQFEKDEAAFVIPEALSQALQTDAEALAYWETLAPSHQRYFVNHVVAAKTIPTQAKRIAQTLSALAQGWDFGQMIRAAKAAREK